MYSDKRKQPRLSSEPGSASASGAWTNDDSGFSGAAAGGSANGGGGTGLMDIAAIANKIQVRANELVAEEQEFQKLKHQLEQQQQALGARRQKMVVETRIPYLQATQKACGLELELYKLQEQTSSCEQERQVLEQNQQELAQRVQEQQEMARIQVESMSAHSCRRLLFQRHLSGLIESKQQSHAKRTQKLQLLRDGVHNLKRQTQDAKDENECVLRNIQSLKQEHETEDDMITQLGVQVRSRLNKRVELRKTLRKLQDTYSQSMVSSECNTADDELE